jgi:hypothetical protein
VALVVPGFASLRTTAFGFDELLSSDRCRFLDLNSFAPIVDTGRFCTSDLVTGVPLLTRREDLVVATNDLDDFSWAAERDLLVLVADESDELFVVLGSFNPNLSSLSLFLAIFASRSNRYGITFLSFAA